MGTEIHQTHPAPREIQQSSFLSVDYYNTGVRGPMKSERALSTSNLANTLVLMNPSLREPQAEDTGSGFGDPQRARDGTSNTPLNVLDIPGKIYKAPKFSSVGIIAKETPKSTSRLSEENFEPKLYSTMNVDSDKVVSLRSIMTSRQHCIYGTPDGSNRDLVKCQTSANMFGL